MPAARVTASRVVYENHWMRLHEDRLERPDGSPGLYAWIEKPPAALIVPLERGRRRRCRWRAPWARQDHVWLIEQHRHPVGRRFWELPQGSWEEHPGAPAETLARGELAEETGLRARTMERLGTLFFAYGMSSQPFDVWLATGLEPGRPALEATEHDLRCARFGVAEFEAMIRRGEIADAATVAAWHLARTR